jgi:hypothetical protein
MGQISITHDAVRELHERMARYEYPAGIWIIGPIDVGYAPLEDSVEAEWLLERAYGRAQRWTVVVVSLGCLEPPVPKRGVFHVEEASGIPLAVLSHTAVPRLRVELHGDCIHVHEVDA